MAVTKYFYELTISSSPHVHSPVTTQTIMRDVLIALAPALLGSVYFFGFRALLVTLLSAAACVFFEWAYCKLTKTPCKIYDMSAALTGVLLAFVCPVTIPSRRSSAALAVTSSTPRWPAVPFCSAILR